MRALVFALGCLLGALFLACGAELSQAQSKGISTTAATIAYCQDLGRGCKADGGSDCYGVYDACMREGGLRD